MKLKKNLLVVALHVLVLAGFALLQGCAGGPCFVDCFNWPYNVPTDEPASIPEEEYTEPEPLPPASFPEEPGMITEIPPVSIPPSTPSVPDQFYTVKKGDTLSGIASMYGISWKEIAAYNGLDNAHKIYPGQELRIDGTLSKGAPVRRSSAPAAPKAPSSGSSDGSVKGSIPQGSSYVIQKGDTLSGIAKRCGLSVAGIKAANALTSSTIVAGKSLSIPKNGEVVAPTPIAEDTPAPVAEFAPFAEPAPAPIADIAPMPPAASSPVYEYVLYPGETIEEVASRFGSTKEEIMQLNDIADPDSIKPGTKLLVPISE